ncbi:hypothetical protein B0H14DRAFT_3436548 [Mycena olivaceomarginata]|nr:hypothetical protein B0H14DRAFT_3436548 [Mycena olivaceomarginata]
MFVSLPTTNTTVPSHSPLDISPSRSTPLHEDSSSEFEDDATPDDDDLDNAGPPDTEDEDVRECAWPTSDDETTASDDATTNGDGDDTTTRDSVGSNQAEAWRTWGAGTPWSWRDLPRGMLKARLPELMLGPVVPESICDFALNQWNQTGFFTDCEPIIEAWEELTPISRGATVGERNAVQELRIRENLPRISNAASAIGMESNSTRLSSVLLYSNRTFTSVPSTASSLYPVSHPVTDIDFNQQRSKWW